MSSFTSPLRVEILEKHAFGRIKASLLQDFEYYSEIGPTVSVPAGYETDFASIPRLFWWITPPLGLYAKAAVVHDYMCDHSELYDRKLADDMFLEGMLVLGVKPILARCMWVAVRGSSIWKGLK